MIDDTTADDLKRRFRAHAIAEGPRGDCPDSERILKVVLGELSSRQNRAFAAHAVECPACTLGWRIAREYARETSLLAAGSSGRRLAPRLWLPLGAAAAAALVGVAFLALRIQPEAPVPPLLRAAPEETIEALQGGGQILPREEFVLRWSALPEGSRYSVRVTDARLSHLAASSPQKETEFLVPAAALASLESGAIVLWQVEAILPDGRRVVSGSFATRVK
jgi:hypothetical protein